MLVVMAIILMLAGITYKVVMKATKKAEEVEDVNDTRQNNIGEFIDAIGEGKSYDELPKQIREGRFHESQ
jgi:type II secretory pathway pseudopilin PulG